MDHAVLCKLGLHFGVLESSHLRLGPPRLAFCHPLFLFGGLFQYFLICPFPKAPPSRAQLAFKVIREYRDSLSGSDQQMG